MLYDNKNPNSIKEYAKNMIGKSFLEIFEMDDNFDLAESNSKSKGELGNLVEQYYFHYGPFMDSLPDFPEAGVELKVTPYKKNRNGSISAKERLVISMIDYKNVVNEEFETSHMWSKAKLILLIYYLYQKEIENRLDYKVDYVTLFTPSEKDIEIIKSDFETIVSKIRTGKAHELSESDTLYLGACTKASTSVDRREQPFSDELAKPRAFAFKNSYMTYVLNNYVINNSKTYESILDGTINMPFERYIIQKISRYEGYTQSEICKELDIDYKSNPKNLGSLIAFRILGISSNNAEEFAKANIVVKTIRIGKNNKIKESMSFPTFKFKEVSSQEWEESQLFNYLSETRFLFVVYKFDSNDELVLQGCQFWNIPYGDLNGHVQWTWNRTKKVLLEGVKIVEKNGKKYNNFPAATENPVCHVRPHAKNASDTDILPNGEKMTKQCFWLNNSYIESQLNRNFFD